MTGSVEPVGIGERLRNAREARGWSLADVSELTRIRATFLQALEEEQFDRLPGRTYLKGFLRTYATALGLNPDELFEAYHLEFETPAQPIVGMHSAEVPIRPAARPSPFRRMITGVAALALVVLVFLMYIGYQQLKRFNASVSRPDATAQPAPQPSPRPAPPSPRPAPPPAPVAPPLPSAAAPLTVILRTTEESWIRIFADGRRVFQGVIAAGEERTWTAQRELTVRVGNAPGVSVEVNGEAVQGPSSRRVWERTFTAP